MRLTVAGCTSEAVQLAVSDGLSSATLREVVQFREKGATRYHSLANKVHTWATEKMERQYIVLERGADLFSLGLFAPVMVCAFCMLLVVRMLMLSRRSTGVTRKVQLGLTIFLLGTTVWASTYLFLIDTIGDSAVRLSPIDLVSSLTLAVSGSAIALWVGQSTRKRVASTMCGVVFGFSVVATLLYAISTLQFASVYQMDQWAVGALSVFGAFVGATAFVLLDRRNLGTTWLAAATFLTVLVCGTQFLFIPLSTPMPVLGSSLTASALEPDLIQFVLFAVLAGCLFCSIAVFAMATHEDRLRRHLIDNVTYVDPLTDLPNRLSLENHLNLLGVTEERKYAVPTAVLLVDLDDFKTINQRYGKNIGDHVLKEIGGRLAEIRSEADYAARIGHDVFALVMTEFSDPGSVEQQIGGILATLADPMSFGDLYLRPGVAAGYAFMPEDTNQPLELIAKAEVALNAAKSDASNRAQRYNVLLETRAKETAALLQDLRGAIDKNEFFLNYQMQHDIRTEELCGFEVLLRWRHPERGLVSPADFIPLAESAGLIRSIGRWVLEEACKEAATWTRAYSIAVNVAPQQLLETGFIDDIEALLEQTGLHPSRLELEVTEASIVEDEERTFEAMHRLRSMGIRVAMDDFGTGYSSLAMLQAFPFDKIKIDRSFVIDVHENPERAAIVEATVLIGEAMSIPILVEGVESPDELTYLRRVRCTIVQGFIFGEPLDVEEVRKLAIIPDKYLAVYN